MKTLRVWLWIVVGIVAVLVFRTPATLAHASWSLRMRRFYVVQGSRWTRLVTYNHRDVDGALLHARLRDGPLPGITFVHPEGVCRWRARLARVETRVRESDFVQLVTHLCTRMAPCTAAVLVGRRAPGCTTRGCFLRSAVFRVTDDDERAAAASIRDAIEVVRRDDARACDTYAERVRLAAVDHVFNKWPLDRIRRADGKVLRAVRGGVACELDWLLQRRRRLEWKCVRDDDGAWALLASPL